MSEKLNLNPLRYFVEVVEQGGFTRAARSLRVAKTLVSRQVARLEATIGASLLVRTTRRVEATEAGRLLYTRAKALLAGLDEAYEAVTDVKAEPNGTLTLTAPHDYSAAVVVPTLTAFLERYPNCSSSLRSNDQTLDLSRGELDLSIRVGWLEDSSNLAQRIGTFQQIAVCHPSLIERHTAPAAPNALAAFPFVANDMLKEPTTWTFSQGTDQKVTVYVTQKLSVDTTQAALAAALGGTGFVVLPDFLVAEDLRAGRLVHLVQDWTLPEGGVYVVYPASKYRPSRVLAFVRMLMQKHAEIINPRQVPHRRN